MTTEQQPISPFMAEVMTAMMSQTHATTNNLIDSLTSQLADSRATVDAIRAGVQGLFDGPYMPMPDSVLAALYPSEQVCDRFRPDGETR